MAASIGLAASCALATRAAAQTPPACPFSTDALQSVFGIAFEAGKPQPGIGTGCTYKTVGGTLKNGTDFTVGVYVNASFPEPQRKLMLAAGTKHTLESVAEDPDRAVVVRHQGDVPAFPQVAYVRRGFDVRLQVVGSGFEADERARRAKIDGFNRKLLKLPRIP
ncbi:MAG: hypothetical protein IT353_17075 [Gemmatimonadaceae bacterium]|nr:hypothetical protein [Gemmatimonadaceae bacterium]